MNNQVQELLEKASIKVLNISKKREEENKEPEIEEFINKSINNGNILLREIFKGLIRKYQKDPLAIGNCQEKKEEHNIECLIRVDNPRISETSGKEETLCEIANSKGHNKIHFIRYLKQSSYDQEEGRIKKDLLNKPGVSYYNDKLNCISLPIKIDTNFTNCSLFKEFKICKFATGKYIVAKIDINTMRDLTTKAYNGELPLLTDIALDKSVVYALKRAYLNVAKKEAQMQSFLDTTIENADIIYYDIYKDLLHKYMSNPDKEIYYIGMHKYYYPRNPNSEINLCNHSAMVDKLGIAYIRHEIDSKKIEYIPVCLSALIKKLQEDYDYGYFGYWDNKSEIGARFNRESLERQLINLRKKIRRRKKENKSKEN